MASGWLLMLPKQWVDLKVRSDTRNCEERKSTHSFHGGEIGRSNNSEFGCCPEIPRVLFELETQFLTYGVLLEQSTKLSSLQCAATFLEELE